jgi:hypothetical protein
MDNLRSYYVYEYLEDRSECLQAGGYRQHEVIKFQGED